ncbi:hypothetical protein X727_26975 [Mesorhizobium sp. L103C119B0]|nr:hypothetical protein X727_26975 [Mesorhizobium sp. L103C119B0]
MPPCDESLKFVPQTDMTARVSAKGFRYFVSVTKCYPGWNFHLSLATQDECQE